MKLLYESIMKDKIFISLSFMLTVVTGSGTGVFNGVTEQINFKGDIGAGNFPYRGPLRF